MASFGRYSLSCQSECLGERQHDDGDEDYDDARVATGSPRFSIRAISSDGGSTASSVPHDASGSASPRLDARALPTEWAPQARYPAWDPCESVELGASREGPGAMPPPAPAAEPARAAPSLGWRIQYSQARGGFKVNLPARDAAVTADVDALLEAVAAPTPCPAMTFQMSDQVDTPTSHQHMNVPTGDPHGQTATVECAQPSNRIVFHPPQQHETQQASRAAALHAGHSAAHGATVHSDALPASSERLSPTGRAGLAAPGRSATPMADDGPASRNTNRHQQHYNQQDNHQQQVCSSLDDSVCETDAASSDCASSHGVASTPQTAARVRRHTESSIRRHTQDGAVAPGSRPFSNSWIHSSPTDPLTMPRLPVPLTSTPSPNRGLPRTPRAGSLKKTNSATTLHGACRPASASSSSWQPAGTSMAPRAAHQSSQDRTSHHLPLQHLRLAPPLHPLATIQPPELPSWQQLKAPRRASHAELTSASSAHSGGGSDGGGSAFAALEIRSKPLTPAVWSPSRPVSAPCPCAEERPLPGYNSDVAMWALSGPPGASRGAQAAAAASAVRYGGSSPSKQLTGSGGLDGRHVEPSHRHSARSQDRGRGAAGGRASGSPRTSEAAAAATAAANVSRLARSNPRAASQSGVPLHQYFQDELVERAARVGNLHGARRAPARTASALSEMARDRAVEEAASSRWG